MRVAKIVKCSMVFLNSLALGLILAFLLPKHFAALYFLNSLVVRIFLIVTTMGVGSFLLYKLLREEPTLDQLLKEKEDILSLPLTSGIEEAAGFTNQITKQLEFLYFSGTYSKTTIGEFAQRLKHLLETSSKEASFSALVMQYQIAVENERFYEKTIWQIASILIPASFALVGYGLKPPQSFVPVMGGFLTYALFLLVFHRFRISLRLFREYAIFLENVLGLYGYTFVYKTHFRAFGAVIRVWTMLIIFGAIYVNAIAYMVLRR